jgi:two-component system chemotaxis sensor kinase CheA
VPLFSLRHLLNLEPSAIDMGKDALRILVLRSATKRAAIAVDAFLWESDAVIQDLGPAAPRNGKVSGGILLEDGTVAFVLNPAELLKAAAHPASSAFLEAFEPVRNKTPSSILVVDDSMTTRTLEKSILEAHGYRVRVAVDGMEALAQLGAEKADLVIADVQMPRMDGFELLDAMNRDSNLNQIPVIVVTSLDRREDQERGLALGARAYIVKRKFDQTELLAAIRQIL